MVQISILLSVRQALYMPALVAARFNPDMKAKYTHQTRESRPDRYHAKARRPRKRPPKGQSPMDAKNRLINTDTLVSPPLDFWRSQGDSNPCFPRERARNENQRLRSKNGLAFGWQASMCVDVRGPTEALRMNPSPRGSLRSGARVGEGPGLAGFRTRRVKHVDQIQRHAACAAQRRLAARRSLPGSSDRS